VSDVRATLIVASALLFGAATAATGQPAPESAEPGTAAHPFLVVEADGRLAVRGAGGAAVVTLEPPPGLESPSLIPAGESWVLTATFTSRGRRELLVLLGADGADPVHVAPPPGRTGPIRTQPVPLLRDGRFDGLAWLEGDDRRRLAVMAATWSGAAWESVQTVAPPAAGTQTALAGAVLDDGAWLLAWSAFDGTDDDVLISQRRREIWSTPARAHADNDTPDITPAVVAYRDGARIAWSRFDGEDYRLTLATLRSSRITEERTLGDPGAVLPLFVRDGGGEQLLYRSVTPYGWTLIEIDAGARPWRRVQFPDTTFGDRAVPDVATDASGAVLSWPESGKRLARPWEPVL
jgi:hypothetical protein